MVMTSPSRVVQSCILFCVFSYIFSNPLYGSVLPRELFGQKLGNTISREGITEILKAPDGSRLFGFEPSRREFPVSVFNHHFLQITPLTGKIISIWATSKYQVADECSEAQKMLVLMIRETFSLDETARQFHRGLVKQNLVMAAACMGEGKDLLVFSLTDMDLLQKSNRERGEILKKRRKRFQKANR